jgi:hypothetical protein
MPRALNQTERCLSLSISTKPEVILQSEKNEGCFSDGAFFLDDVVVSQILAEQVSQEGAAKTNIHHPCHKSLQPTVFPESEGTPRFKSAPLYMSQPPVTRQSPINVPSETKVALTPARNFRDGSESPLSDSCVTLPPSESSGVLEERGEDVEPDMEKKLLQDVLVNLESIIKGVHENGAMVADAMPETLPGDEKVGTVFRSLSYRTIRREIDKAAFVEEDINFAKEKDIAHLHWLGSTDLRNKSVANSASPPRWLVTSSAGA